MLGLIDPADRSRFPASNPLLSRRPKS